MRCGFGARSYRRSRRPVVLLALAAACIIVAGAIGAPACSAMGELPAGSAKKMLYSSPNYRDGLFHNEIPVRHPSMLAAFKEWMRGAEHTTPEAPLPVMKRTKEAFVAPPKSGLRITWIGHSTSLVEIDGARLLLDPTWSERSSPMSWNGPKRFFEPPVDIAALPPIDAVLISHDHYDHLDKRTVQLLAAQQMRFIVPLGVDARLIGFGVPAEKIDALDWWEPISVGDIVVTATPARHFSGRSLLDRDKTLWAGYAMVGDSHRVYYTGDTGMFPGFKAIGDRLGPFDATLVEIGAYNRLWADLHLGPEQAVRAVRDAKGGLLIPVHWATFNLAMHSWVEPAERLMVAATKKGVHYAFPRPGESVEPGVFVPVARWWPKLPWQTAQQHPIVASELLRKE